MKAVYWICLLLVIVGAVNWGLVGLFQFDLVATLLGGATSMAARAVYSVVGIAGLALAAIAASLASQRDPVLPRV